MSTPKEGAGRRRFLQQAAAGLAGAGGALWTPAALAQLSVGGLDKFDLVIRNGDVVDPSQNLRGKRDIGIKNGRVTLITAEIPADKAAQSLDA
ncbi:MAG: hypothetical protein MO853_05100 [Candidatus Protistobacter heckmanni]|nr:hypothetical protein [Candidatus Protistobacter heckmanni]